MCTAVSSWFDFGRSGVHGLSVRAGLAFFLWFSELDFSLWIFVLSHPVFLSLGSRAGHRSRVHRCSSSRFCGRSLGCVSRAQVHPPLATPVPSTGKVTEDFSVGFLVFSFHHHWILELVQFSFSCSAFNLSSDLISSSLYSSSRVRVMGARSKLGMSGVISVACCF
jgi:hypothetical protein